LETATYDMNTEFELFPDAASTAAPQVDALFWFLMAISTVLSVGIAATLIYFAIKYRKSARVDRTQRPTSLSTEFTWIGAALPVLLLIFLWGAKVGFYLLRPPADAMAINVVAKQWMWKFQHPDGRREIDTLHVPVGQPVRLTMVSQDVIHSFFVPAFRVKQDVLPGRYTNAWFEATKPGAYRLYCAEYCGTDHSRMKGTIVAMTPADFAAWLAGEYEGDEPPQVAGEKLFDQLQCGTCHRRDGEAGRGPSLAGVFGSQVPLATGDAVQADDGYLRESILRPAKKVVAGFQPIMPAYEGQITEEGVMELIAYIKSLQPPDASPTQ
jgi:cytochrome c oxidase subunit 2